MKILFAGTAIFALPALELLYKRADVELVGVITQPDRPVGRKQELQSTPVKEKALELDKDIQIFEPEKLSKEAESILAATNPDVLVVAAYGQFIPSVMLTEPKFGAINIHGSLLPELRGAVPVHMAILQGLEKTGVTLQKMVKEMDAGDIIVKKEYKFSGSETTGNLMTELANLGAEVLAEFIDCFEAEKEIPMVPQNDEEATFCYMKDIAKEKAEITARVTASRAERMTRAFNPWPIAWLKVPNGPKKGERLKVFSAELIPLTTGKFELTEVAGKLVLNFSKAALQLNEVQLAGKNKRNGTDYLWLVSE